MSEGVIQRVPCRFPLFDTAAGERADVLRRVGSGAVGVRDEAPIHLVQAFEHGHLSLRTTINPGWGGWRTSVRIRPPGPLGGRENSSAWVKVVRVLWQVRR